MKYTRRVDGENRANHRFSVALSREELKDFNARAIKMGYTNFRSYIQGQIGNAFVRFEDEWADFEKELGNG